MATTAVWSLNDKPWPPGSCLDPSMNSRSSDGSTSSTTVDSVRNSILRTINSGEDLLRAERSEANETAAGPLVLSKTLVTSNSPQGSSSEREEDFTAHPTAGQESFLLQDTDRVAPSHTHLPAEAAPVEIGLSADNPISSIVAGTDHHATGLSSSGTASVAANNAGRNRVWDKLCNLLRPYYYYQAAPSTSTPLLVAPSSSDSHLGSASSNDGDRTALRAAAHHTRSSSYNSRLFCFGVLPPTLAIPCAAPAPAAPSRTLLPPLQPHMQLSNGRAARKTLVLDLDETLVHSSFSEPPNADFIVPLTMDGRTACVFVLKRPGVERFLSAMAPIFEVVVFTASLARYADPVLDLLDPTGELIHHRLFRESCVQMESGGGYVKDLSILGRDLADVLLVDNSPLSYARQPANGVPISSFIDDPRDVELLALIPFLEHMARVGDDVRRHLGGGGAWVNVGSRESAGRKQLESGCKQAMC
ncbi:unnamed protein product [Closterium sp. NIES-65]|nr:unnamed protein product [Closterium sp. NIES-65]